MKEALGLVEIRGLANTILVADTMVKTSNVKLIDIENSKGLGYMTIKVVGDVGAVNASVNSGRISALENNAFISAKVIPRPSNYVENIFCQLEKEEREPNNEENNENSTSESIINISFEDIDNKKVDEIINEENKEDKEDNDEVKEIEETDIDNLVVEENKPKKSGRKKKVVKKEND